MFLGELGLGYHFIPFSLKKSLDVYFVFVSSEWSMENNNNLRTQSIKPLGGTWDSNHYIILFLKILCKKNN
jgi:hypothetical protein